MNLLTQIQTSAASDAVKGNAAKYFELIARWMFYDPDFVSSDEKGAFVFEWYKTNKQHIHYGGVHFNDYGHVAKLDYGDTDKWTCINNPTSEDFEAAFNWLGRVKE